MKTRDVLVAALTATFLSAGAWQVQAAEPLQSVKFALDWAYQGNHAFWSQAIDDGTFKKLGLDVQLNRGYGSGDTIIKVAAGAYDIGFADINTMIKFDAEHPDQQLIAVYQVFDRTPNSVITLKRTGIAKPTDLDGRKIGGSQGDASRMTFPMFAKLNKVKESSIEWVTVAPNLRETLLVQGQVDAITGFATTSIFNLIAAGVPRENIVTMPFAEYGLDLYGTALIVRPAFLKAHPDIVRAFVNATIAGEIATIKNSDQALQTLKTRDPLFDIKLEKARLDMLLADSILTPAVKTNGLGYVDPARMTLTIQVNTDAYGIKNVPTLETIYTTEYLPPQSERMPPKWQAE